jgi:hypothetical protein
MKTKIFLMAVIAGLISYIIFDLREQDAHHHNSNQSNPLSPPSPLLGNDAIEPKHNQHPLSKPVQKQESTHQHLDSNVHTDHEEENNAEQEHHHVIPEHIKKELCLADNDVLSCTVDLNKDLANILLDETGNMLAEEITTVLDSNNFQDVLELLSTQKETNEAFMREDGYQHELNRLTGDLNIQSTPLYCSETICAMTMQYQDLDSSKTFFSKFFNKSNKGNIFLSQRLDSNRKSIVERVMFFPENKNGVIVPELN